MKKADYIAKYGEEAWEKEKEKNRNRYRRWYTAHKQENPRKDYLREWRENNEGYFKEWHGKNPEYDKERYKTETGRANAIFKAYKQNDKIHNRGECTLTPEWIIDNVFTSKCIYCGESNWRKLGCDRINNDLPHTPDNVVCCCADCNLERQEQGFEAFLYKSWRKRFN